MKNRKIKRRLDGSNWIRYITPVVRDGVTYLCNQRQLVTAYGKPMRKSPHYPSFGVEVEMSVERLLDEIKYTGESFSMGAVNSGVIHFDEDAGPYQFVKFEDIPTSLAPKILGGFLPRQNIPEVTLDFTTSHVMEDGSVKARGVSLNQKPPMPPVAPLGIYEVSDDRTHVSMNFPNSANPAEAAAYQKALDEFVISERNRKGQFVHIESVEADGNHTLKANVVLTPRSEEEIRIVQKIKDGL